MNKKYLEQYKLLYQLKPKYGASSVKFFDILYSILKNEDVIYVLDYGCGKSPLLDMLKDKLNHLNVFKYDPVFPEYDILPKQKIDFVICTDVLQHVPLEELDETLSEIALISNRCFFHIKCTDHPTKFPNGEPTNITVREKQWWKKYLLKFFSIVEDVDYPDETTATFKTK
mgnify:CR=1 FL=1